MFRGQRYWTTSLVLRSCRIEFLRLRVDQTPGLIQPSLLAPDAEPAVRKPVNMTDRKRSQARELSQRVIDRLSFGPKLRLMMRLVAVYIETGGRWRYGHDNITHTDTTASVWCPNL